MIIAKNDEDKRSRVWNYVTGITTVLIIIVAGYFIYQGFFGNPLEGKWKHDESDMILEVDDHNEAELIEFIKLGLMTQKAMQDALQSARENCMPTVEAYLLKAINESDESNSTFSL